MKVYSHPNKNIFKMNPHSDLVAFHYEKDKFEFVHNLNEADIVPIMFHGHDVEKNLSLFKYLHINQNQLIVFLDIFHGGDDDNTFNKQNCIDFFKNHGYNSVVVHTYHNINNYNLIFYDHMWNRQKIYFTDYDNYDLTNRYWTFKATKKMFELNEIRPKTLTKKFLIPNKTYKQTFLLSATGVDESDTFRSKARVVLEKSVLEQDCYYSNPNNYIFLEPQEFDDNIINDRHFLNMGMGFAPIANKYYDTSAISVYVETLASSKSKQELISEKTYNPLIKGHFIIPFSYPGIIRDLKEIYGFKFPDWIDYSYDTIEDDQERFHEFMKSFSRVRFLTLEQLEEKCNSDIDILYHNRQIFYDRPYHSLYESLSKSINTIYRRS